MTQSKLIDKAKLEIEKQKYKVLVKCMKRFDFLCEDEQINLRADTIEDAKAFIEGKMLSQDDIYEKSIYKDIEQEVQQLCKDACRDVIGDLECIIDVLKG